MSAPAGSYLTACKPGMKGDGIRADFTVTDSGDEGQHLRRRADAGRAGAEGVRARACSEQSDELARQDHGIREGLPVGRRPHAPGRSTPRPARPWERIETVAESFGDLDPKMDAREADLEPGQKWTGWHRIEKDLWPARAGRYAPLTTKQRAAYADDLLANTETLDHRIGRPRLHRRPDRQRLSRADGGGRHAAR